MAEIRLEVLLEAARSGETVAEVCRRRGISRKAYYRYLRRYQAEGVGGLELRSKAPLAQPARMASEVELEICRMRKDRPRWGHAASGPSSVGPTSPPPPYPRSTRGVVPNDRAAWVRVAPGARQRGESAPYPLSDPRQALFGLTERNGVWERVFVPTRPNHLAREELEQLRRSIAMLQPGSLAMRREDAMHLLSELGDVQVRLDRLRGGLRALLEESD